MKICEDFPLDLYIFYRCISFCLPPSDIFTERKFDVCDLPQSSPYLIALPDTYYIWVFWEGLKR